jgi:hypothetical protein
MQCPVSAGLDDRNLPFVADRKLGNGLDMTVVLLRQLGMSERTLSKIIDQLGALLTPNIRCAVRCHGVPLLTVRVNYGGRSINVSGAI